MVKHKSGEQYQTVTYRSRNANTAPFANAGGSLGGAGPGVGSPVSVAALTAAAAGGKGSGRGGGWLLDSPVLAVGCSDGIVRCLQIFPVKVGCQVVSDMR